VTVVNQVKVIKPFGSSKNAAVKRSDTDTGSNNEIWVRDSED